jgi:hypothetical protein
VKKEEIDQILKTINKDFERLRSLPSKAERLALIAELEGDLRLGLIEDDFPATVYDESGEVVWTQKTRGVWGHPDWIGDTVDIKSIASSHEQLQGWLEKVLILKNMVSTQPDQVIYKEPPEGLFIKWKGSREQLVYLFKTLRDEFELIDKSMTRDAFAAFFKYLDGKSREWKHWTSAGLDQAGVNLKEVENALADDLIHKPFQAVKNTARLDQKLKKNKG